MSDVTSQFTAFVGPRLIATGALVQVALAAKAELDRTPDAAVLLFEDVSGQTVDVDYRGGPQDVARRLEERFAVPEPEAPRGRGRPRLGVVAREVTLLPRHWDWLSDQPGGASVALRKLVEEARRAGEGPQRRREAQQAAYRFTSALAGNAPGFEEATRALFAGDAGRFAEHTQAWPADVRDHARRLASAAFERTAAQAAG